MKKVFVKTNNVKRFISMYNNLLEKIKELYEKSEEYIIPTKPELEDLLYDTEKYMHEVFNSIANASGRVSDEEKAFIEKLTIYEKRKSIKR